MATEKLTEIDTLEIVVVVDNEMDPISPSPNPAVQQPGRMTNVLLTNLEPSVERGGSTREFRMENLCCGAHGLSLMITATRGLTSHTLLFDAGPEGRVWETNAARMRLPVERVDHVHLSHWHPDHSGGMVAAIRAIGAARLAQSNDITPMQRVVVDVHPDRPDFRGMRLPTGEVVSMERDPSFAELVEAGGDLRKEGDVHAVLDGMFLVSGSIPRETSYEKGIRSGMRLVDGKMWVSDEAIMDERFVMCNLKGKGLVVFTGCSHAGVINVSQHAKELGVGNQLYCVVGGYHLADADEEKIERSIEDLKALDPKILMPGHCTGWRFKYVINREMPSRMVPSFAGTKYIL